MQRLIKKMETDSKILNGDEAFDVDDLFHNRIE